MATRSEPYLVVSSNPKEQIRTRNNDPAPSNQPFSRPDSELLVDHLAMTGHQPLG
jgi:hypothetical protein